MHTWFNSLLKFLNFCHPNLGLCDSIFILAYVTEICISFNLQCSANEGIKHTFNLSFNQMRQTIFWQTKGFTIKMKHGRNSVLCDYSLKQKL